VTVSINFIIEKSFVLSPVKGSNSSIFSNLFKFKLNLQALSSKCDGNISKFSPLTLNVPLKKF